MPDLLVQDNVLHITRVDTGVRPYRFWYPGTLAAYFLVSITRRTVRQ